ncbi:MAG: hypothetical protein A4E65_03708 [Syntrophorhabdus sp. PtaU1.Bin153]|nr:MAG: hypothetical protein A4E65_03708 [Syntrophorhabdus sp. PtaU1.Bin153]
MKAYYRPDEVAKYVGVSVKTIYRRMELGLLEYHIVAGFKRIPRAAVQPKVEEE